MLGVHSCPVPVIAKVDGVCVGAGLGLALAADLTWCSDRARFSAIFAKRGLSLDFGTSWLLRQRLGVHKAKELAFTAKMISGARGATTWAWSTRSSPPTSSTPRSPRSSSTIAGGPPVALSHHQAGARQRGELARSPTRSRSRPLAQSVNVQTDDMREALMAYIERRPANFTGR